MNRIILALALVLGATTLLAEDAFAGKKPDAAASANPEDKYKSPEMKVTKVPEFDTFFTTAKAPIDSLIGVRKKIDTAQARINTAVGVGADMTFKDALNELVKKVGKNATLTMKSGGKLPKLTPKDALPSDVTAIITEFNGAIDDMELAFTELEGIKGEIMKVADEAAALPAKTPDAIKAAGLPATDAMSVPKNVTANVKTLATAKDEVVKLTESLNTMVTDLKASFGEISS